ncbi:LuxR C-terminal-related transcriptional regulator [Lentzea sp. NPDC004782]|uniref:ATP-binding protein n=1 Tax=Lentzea sp. NPDC004782 TaxID=3154458 RepID=UPI0033A45694
MVQRPKGNLPAELTSFIGRRREIAAAKKVLPEVRLLTLTGVGGVGKTRLALQVATQTRRAFSDGAWLVELAPLQRQVLLEQAVADAVGLQDQSGRPPREVLAGYLRGKQALLVLDNCEHLSDSCAVLASELLAAAPRLRILATSRKALRTPGEHILPVPPLTLPDTDSASPNGLATNDTVRLFADRAAAVVPEFTVTEANLATVASICQRLDGLPLAIELAAAQVRILSPQQILRRLDDRFRLLTADSPAVLPRHQTLRAVLDWSFELCSPAEQLLWARMSVFAGGCDLDAVEAVCAGDIIDQSQVIDLIAGLMDKSILVRDEPSNGAPVRYRMLETVRQYGKGKRQAGEDGMLRRRHRDYFLSLAEHDAARWFGPNQREITDRTRREHANLRVALKHCLTTPGESQAGLRMATALYYFWFGCGLRSEGRHWLDEMLALDDSLSRAGATALCAAADLAAVQDPVAAIEMATKCRRWAQSHDDQTMLAHALFALGTAEWSADNLPRGRALLEEALNLFETLGEPNTIMVLTYQRLSGTVGFSGDLDLAIELALKACDLCEKHGERMARAYVLNALSFAESRRGELTSARKHAREALRDLHAFDDKLGMGVLFERLAWIAGTMGDGERAASLLAAAEKMSIEGGGKPLAGFSQFRAAHDQCERQAREVLGDQAFEAALKQGAEIDVAQTISYALGENSLTSPRPRQQAAADDPLASLTRRERQVAELVAEGLSNKDIASRLVIAERTVEGHVQNVHVKLGFTKRVQLAAWFIEQRQTGTSDEAEVANRSWPR